MRPNPHSWDSCIVRAASILYPNSEADSKQLPRVEVVVEVDLPVVIHVSLSSHSVEASRWGGDQGITSFQPRV